MSNQSLIFLIMKKTNFKFLYVLFCTMLSANLVAQNEFISTWKTDNTGTSGTTEITIPTDGTGYDYDVDWNNDGTFDEIGLTGNVTHDFGTAGTYTIRIQGDFPRIRFNGGGDSDKILDVSQWGNMAWTSMAQAFRGCSNLNFTAIDTPDLSSVSSFSQAFQQCTVFNSNIDSWDVSNVTTFYSMFKQCPVFNQPLNSWTLTSAVTMASMFSSTTLFNQPLDSWDMSNVESIYGLFWSCIDFNQDISGWNTSSVENMANTFNNANDFEQNIGNWDVSNVTNATSMLYSMTLSTANYDSLLIGWGAQNLQSGVTFSGGGSEYCQGDTSRNYMTNTMGWTITDGGQDCSGDEFVTTWKTDNSGTSGTTEITIPTTGIGYNYDVDWDNNGTYDEFGLSGDVTHDFGTAGTYTIRIKGEFSQIYFNDGGDKGKLLDVTKWGSNVWSSFSRAFFGCENMDISATDVPDLSSATTMDRALRECDNLLGTNLASWDVSTITSFHRTFEGCDIFNTNIDSWNVSSGANFSRMFINSIAYNQPMNSWDVSSGTDFQYMFSNCDALDQDLDNWNTSGANNMNRMFNSCDVFNGDVTTWDTDTVTNFAYMFSQCPNFNQNLNGWDVSSGATFSQMFSGDTSYNQPMDAWNTISVTNISHMFNGATTFDQDLGGWDVSGVTTATSMFAGDSLSITNYDNLLVGWGQQNVQSGVSLDAGYSVYCTGKEYKDTLVLSDLWTIIDGGLETTAPTPDLTTLSDVNSVCEIVSLTAPTATDNCTSNVTVTSDAVLPISNLGTTVVTWTYVDENGNASTQTQNVIIDAFELGVILNTDGVTLESENSDQGVTYQWIDCSTNLIVQGEANQSFTPQIAGDYAVVITQGGCSDTSDCVSSAVSLDELNTIQVLVYPNPSNGIFTIKADQDIVGLEVIDMIGRKVDVEINLQTGMVNGNSLSNGRYFLQITTQEARTTKEIIIKK
jgi:surface protein